MTTTTLKEAALAALLVPLVCVASLAQQNDAAESSEIFGFYADASAPNAPDIIFSNLAPTPGNRYNSNPAFGFPVVGVSASGETESLEAIAIIPKVDAQAKVLLAAINYISGTRLVNLGLYSDDGFGTVGTLLPGGQGSTAQLPDSGECCRLAKVILPGNGVTLKAATKYWLVASPDNVNAPTFRGAWQLSYAAQSGYLAPPTPWTIYSGQWPAAQILGTNRQALAMDRALNPTPTSSAVNAPPGNVTLFTNLGPTATERYNFFQGSYVAGNSAFDISEQWVALPFTPRVDSHAKTLAAPIAYISGTKKVNLGVYSDSAGTVGTLLPGGQASTTEIPDVGECCALTKVTLPGAGIALTNGVQYWLVASPDNINAPDFGGLWYDSNLAVSAYEEPENTINWTSFTAGWLAAEIRGTNP